jgi:nicotinic acid mononucleotide adenylyltransferase
MIDTNSSHCHTIQAYEARGSCEERLGTIDIVEMLRRRHPEYMFTLVLGGDTFLDLCGGRWKRGDDLARLVDFVVVPRVDCPLPDDWVTAAKVWSVSPLVLLPALCLASHVWPWG